MTCTDCSPNSPTADGWSIPTLLVEWMWVVRSPFGRWEDEGV